MSHKANPGDIKVLSSDDKSIFVTGKGNALIRNADVWTPLKALVAIDRDAMKVTVRIKSADIMGLPYPTGIVTIDDPVAGWSGFAAVY